MERIDTSYRPKHYILGARIKAARKALGLTQDQLCVRMGHRPENYRPHLIRIERGDIRPHDPTLVKIAAAAGTTFEELTAAADTDEEAAQVIAEPLDQFLVRLLRHPAIRDELRKALA